MVDPTGNTSIAGNSPPAVPGPANQHQLNAHAEGSEREADAPSSMTRGRSRFWPQSFSDIVQLVGLFLGLLSAPFLLFQLKANNETNQVAIRGQLYQTENGLMAQEASDKQNTYATTWTYVPSSVTGQAYSRRLLGLISPDPSVLYATSPSALYHSVYDAAVLASAEKRVKTDQVRRLFVFIQSNVYHIHNAFDYYRGGVMNEAEWKTWKGLIEEMNAHPVLLTAIWHGYQHRYFSRKFGEFLRTTICERSAFGTDYAERNCQFARGFYPDMFASAWTDGLPDY